MRNPFKYHKLYHYYLTWNELGTNTKVLLDYGCGKGEFISKLKNKVRNVYGFDVDPEKTSFIEKKYPYIKIKKIKITDRLPYIDNFFDVVTMFHVLEHVHSEKRTINEIYRILKPGGKLYLASPYAGVFEWADTANLRYRFPKVHKWFIELIHNEEEYERRFISKENIGLYGDCSANRNWHHHYTEEEIKKLLSNKFRIESFYKFSVFHPFLLVLGNIWDYLFKSENKIIKKMMWVDNKIKANELSYNMLVIAKKIS